MKRAFRVAQWRASQAGPELQSASKLTFVRPPSGAVNFTATGPAETSWPAKSLITYDAANLGHQQTFQRISDHAAPFEPGLFAFSDWVVAGNAGLLLNLQDGLCLLDDALGWGMDFAQWHTRNQFGAVWNEALTSFTIDLPATITSQASPNAMMIAAPGHTVYGHWLLDYIPRLHFMMTNGLPMDNLFIGDLPVWAKPFLAMFGVDDQKLSRLNAQEFTLFRHMAIPGFLKRGYVLHQTTCRSAWAFLADQVTRQPTGTLPGHGPKIFVSRSRWPSNRTIANIASVEAMASARGYVIVHPETVSLSAQAGLFWQARVIVGQDGSALHNVIFCRPGAVLGVISLPERHNYWHVSICEALDHRIACLDVAANPEGAPRIDQAAFDVFLSALETAMTA